MGEVADAWYASTDAVHMLVYSLPAGGWFGSTDDVRTVFDADQLYYVLDGTLALANPATGEVRVVETGEAAHVGPGTWTHGVVVGDAPLRVLELVAPGLESEQAVSYTRAQPPLGHPTYVRGNELRRRWPMARRDDNASATIVHLRESDLLWRLDGAERVLVGTWISTDRSAVDTVRLRPGQRMDVATLRKETCVFVLDGPVGVLAEGEQPRLELHARDGLHLPAGCTHRFHGVSGAEARFLRLTAA